MMPLSQQWRRHASRRRGAALVISLAMIVLVTVAILAFFSMAAINRQIESSRTNLSKADLLAKSGGAYAIGLVLAEITDPNRSVITTTSGVSIFEPKVSTNAWLARYLSTAQMKDPTFFNLVQQSVPAMDTNASTDNTAQAASNGRTVDTNRWNEPCLLTGSGFTTASQIPNWVYVSRVTGATNTATSAVVGRFAYNIYSLNGLLNANVAGTPSGVAAIANLTTYLKASQAGADLTQLTNNPPVAILQASVDALTAFRFPDNPSATNYVGRMVGASTSGYLSVQNTDWFQGTAFKQNMFESRQDLIRYATTQNTSLIPALPYLTHFSRALDAPSYKPAAVTASNPDIPNVRFAVAGAVTHYDDKGVSSTYSVIAGEPLIQRRFSLAKLAWLTFKGPSADLPTTDPVYYAGGTDANIQTCFGLQWNSAQERWDYVGPTGTTVQGSIETLAQIAAETAPREPNFFETLKAGILSNTLGAAALDGCDDKSNLNNVSLCPAANNVLDANKDLHVLQIGANIIDNQDADNYPTRIGMQFGSVVIEKAGVEDLPYFYTVAMPVLMSGTTYPRDATHNYWSWRFSPVEWVWIPELFEPHRPSTTTVGPSSVQINFLPNSILVQAGFSQNSAFNVSESSAVLNRDLSVLPAIQVLSNNFANFRNGPQPVTNAVDPNTTLGVMMPAFITSSTNNTNPNVAAFHLLSYSDSAAYPQGLPMIVNAGGGTNANGSPVTPSTSNVAHLAFMQTQNIIMRLQYLTPAGQWKTYSTLGGNEALSSTDPSVSTGIWGSWRDDFGISPSPPGAWIPILKQMNSFINLGYSSLDDSSTAGTTKTLNYANSCRLVPYDPRGSRFGAADGHYSHFLGTVPTFTVNGPAGTQETFSDALFYPTSYFSGNYTGNLPQTNGFQDSDGIARMPDGGLGNLVGAANNNLTTNVANPYSNVTSSAGYPARPVILQRPYQSVAELGYVYRDVPWQTLNFYNNQSGDSPLLDLFSVRDEPAVTAGRVFLASQQLPVLAALLSGTPQEPDGTLPYTAANAQTIAAAFKNYTYLSTKGTPSTTLAAFPMSSADLVNFMYSPSSGWDTGGTKNANILIISPIKNRREAVVRALGSTAQMRTWNILIDMVAQTGRFPGQSFTAGNFILEGESHRWISVAIDRYTGKIVDEQIEKVNE